jgi:hypothetical protein
VPGKLFPWPDSAGTIIVLATKADAILLNYYVPLANFESKDRLALVIPKVSP